MQCFIMKLPDSKSLLVNWLGGCISPGPTLTGFKNNVFISFALKWKQINEIFNDGLEL